MTIVKQQLKINDYSQKNLIENDTTNSNNYNYNNLVVDKQEIINLNLLNLQNLIDPFKKNISNFSNKDKIISATKKFEISMDEIFRNTEDKIFSKINEKLIKLEEVFYEEKLNFQKLTLLNKFLEEKYKI